MGRENTGKLITWECEAKWRKWDNGQFEITRSNAVIYKRSIER